jgi:membrane-associated protein
MWGFTSFLPGDSLLFVLGITLAATTNFPVWLAIPLVIVSAFAGSQVGFLTGHAVGPVLFERRRTWIFNPTFVTQAHESFDRFGPRAIILARFVPIVRALVPMLAGISKMDRRTFLLYNLLGATIWVTSLVGIGYLLGEAPFVADHIDTAILVVIIVTSLPFPLELLREWIIRKRLR